MRNPFSGAIPPDPFRVLSAPLAPTDAELGFPTAALREIEITPKVQPVWRHPGKIVRWIRPNLVRPRQIGRLDIQRDNYEAATLLMSEPQCCQPRHEPC
jgi:hypothetical protein